MSGAEKRKALDKFCIGDISVDELADEYPDCACERAESPENSPGPVMDEERLRYFLTSTSDIDGKRATQLQKRPFKVKSLKRAFTTGLSVCRLAHASSDELELTASKLHQFQFQKNENAGGVLATLDFSAGLVRAPIDKDAAKGFCVLETPLDQKDDGTFERPSHADIVNSLNGLTDEQKKTTLDLMYNRMVKDGVQTKAEEVADCDLKPFLPNALKNA